MECSHTRPRALSVTQPEQESADPRQRTIRSVRSASTQQLATNGSTVPNASEATAIEVSSPELTTATTKATGKKPKRSASFLGITRVPSFLRGSVSLAKPELPDVSEVPEMKTPLMSVKAIQRRLTRRQTINGGSAPVSASANSLNPIASNQIQRRRMLALPLDEGAASSSGASASASARLLPPKQGNYTWQNLFLEAKAASAACKPEETLAEVPNAFLQPWRISLCLYLYDLRTAFIDFAQLAKYNADNTKADLLRQCLEKAIELGNNVHPLLFKLTYKLVFCRHAFSQQEAKGLFCFLKEELKTFKNQTNPLTEYQKIITYLYSYLNLICKSENEKSEVKIPTLKLVRSKSFKSSLIINNPTPDAYISPIYLNNGTVLAMRKYIAMNKAFLSGFSKVNTALVITTKESELINKIIEKNINAVTDIALLFTEKNSNNHYGNFLNKSLDGYYQSTKEIPENLKKEIIQKLVKIMLAKLIDEGLTRSHLGDCLKSPFHLAKDEFGREDFELHRQNPRLAAIVVKFQRAFMECLLNELANLRITESAKEKASSKTPLSEQGLTQGFNQILNYFSRGDLETLLATDAQVHWEKIKAELEKR